MKKAILTSGTRKTSVARATLKAGTGVIRINAVPLEHYDPPYAKDRIEEALILGDKYSDKVDISIKVQGGGKASQADAIRIAIAKALLEFSKDAKINFFLDSRLVFSQIVGIFKIKNATLRDLLFSVRDREAQITFPIFYKNIPREQNTKADQFVNQALDQEASNL